MGKAVAFLSASPTFDPVFLSYLKLNHSRSVLGDTTARHEDKKAHFFRIFSNAVIFRSTYPFRANPSNHILAILFLNPILRTFP